MMRDGGTKEKGSWASGTLAILLGVAIGAAGVGAWYGFRAPDRAGTEAIVRDYLLEHGEVIFEAIDRHRSRQAMRAIGGQRTALETPFHGAWAGAADGDVTLVQFFDYACGYCRQSNADVERLLREDPRLKVVWREYPVLGPASDAAARLSLAAARQGRFREFHARLFALGRPTEAVLQQAAQQAGVQAEPQSAEMQTELSRNTQMGRLIEAQGTPTFVVGEEVLHGAVGYQALRAAIARTREARNRT
jgi:protein-disulfide isomerase